MGPIFVSLIAHQGAGIEVFQRGEQLLMDQFPGLSFQVSEKEFDFLFILTGGSEKQAMQLIKNQRFVLILALSENNAFAAASEVKAYCQQKQIGSIIINLQVEKNLQPKLKNYLACMQALKQLSKQTVALLGNPSDWLIASTVKEPILDQKLGIQIQRVTWEAQDEVASFSAQPAFLKHFNKNGTKMEASSQVYALLRNLIQKEKVDAITVECFPMVKEQGVTACLALSKLNAEGIPAGCEGDLTSIIGKMIAKTLTGQIPWMANLVAIEEESVFFAHCTISTDLVTDFTITTHFETGVGTALQGNFKSNHVTVMRLKNDLSKGFLSRGNILERPKRSDACRTQIAVKLPSRDLEKLRKKPLGNHHLILPGDHCDLLKSFFKLIDIEVI